MCTHAPIYMYVYMNTIYIWLKQLCTCAPQTHWGSHLDCTGVAQTQWGSHLDCIGVAQTHLNDLGSHLDCTGVAQTHWGN